MESKGIEWALTAPAIDVGPMCSSVPVPKLPEGVPCPLCYEQGYRDALYAARHFFEVKQHPLLQCVDCKNTESTAGAMARAFNQGRCVHCGGYFKVVKA